jgi:TIR domain-containing protein
MNRLPHTFFIAHAGRDTERAKELRNLLHPDVAVFLDAYDLQPGDEWDVKLARHQREALATVVMLSASVDLAYYLREEIANAVALQRQDPDTHRLIPVYLDGLPRNPMDVPYGLRVRHALDARELGMAGVAAELKRLAASLQGKPPPEAPDEAPAPVDRIAVFDALCRLLQPQFSEVLFRTNAPNQQLAPASEPLARRALDLVQWAEQGGAERMSELALTIRRVAPGVLV